MHAPTFRARLAGCPPWRGSALTRPPGLSRSAAMAGATFFLLSLSGSPPVASSSIGKALMATWAESVGHGADRERWEGPLSQCGIAHAVGSVAPLVGGVPASEGPQSHPAHHGWAVSQPADRYGHRPLAWRALHRSWMLCQKRSYLVLYLRGISGRIRQLVFLGAGKRPPRIAQNSS